MRLFCFGGGPPASPFFPARLNPIVLLITVLDYDCEVPCFKISCISIVSPGIAKRNEFYSVCVVNAAIDVNVVRDGNWSDES